MQLSSLQSSSNNNNEQRMHIKCLFNFKIGKLFPSNFYPYNKENVYCFSSTPVLLHSAHLYCLADTVTLLYNSLFSLPYGCFLKHEELTQVWYYFYILSEIKLLSWSYRRELCAKKSKRRVLSSFLNILDKKLFYLVHKHI